MTEQDERALAAGLPVERLAVLIRARQLWHETNGGQVAAPGVMALTAPLPAGWWLSDELLAAVAHPAAAEWDAVFCAAMRRGMG